MSPNPSTPPSIAAYCNQFMNNIGGQHAPPAPGSPQWVECVKYGWNLPTTGGGVGSAVGHVSPVVLILIIAIIAFVVFRRRRPATAKR